MSHCIDAHSSRFGYSTSGGSSHRTVYIADPTMTAYAKLRSLSAGLTIFDGDADHPRGPIAGVSINGQLKNGRHIYTDSPPVYPTLERAIQEALKIAEANGTPQ